MTTPSRLWLVPYDFSPASAASLELAASELGELGGGHLVVLHVFSVPEVPVAVPGLPAGAAGAGNRVDLVHLVEKHLQDSLKGTVEAAATGWKKSVSFETVVLRGQAHEAILRTAEDRGVVRIVMGSHGRTGLKHFLLGSVATRVARLSAVPVLVVKAPEPAAG